MSISRRHFLGQAAAVAAVPLLPASTTMSSQAIVKPRRMAAGQTVGVISPASATHDRADVGVIEDTMAALGLKTVFGPNAFARYGYLGGTDEQRVADVHWAFSNSDIDVVLAFRGGWGCNRLLPLLDYNLIAQNPKPLLGYSDITGLLVGLYAKAGLVSFHGPPGMSTWNTFTVDYVRRVLFEAEAVHFANPTAPGDRLAR
ncbi:MAG: LD-carboxypeptidase, partial [Bacteroidota bacterium]